MPSTAAWASSSWTTGGADALNRGGRAGRAAEDPAARHPGHRPAHLRGGEHRHGGREVRRPHRDRPGAGLRARSSAGLHCHVGSMVFDESVFEDTADVMFAFMRELKDGLGYVTRDARPRRRLRHALYGGGQAGRHPRPHRLSGGAHARSRGGDGAAHALHPHGAGAQHRGRRGHDRLHRQRRQAHRGLQEPCHRGRRHDRQPALLPLSRALHRPARRSGRRGRRRSSTSRAAAARAATSSSPRSRSRRTSNGATWSRSAPPGPTTTPWPPTTTAWAARRWSCCAAGSASSRSGARGWTSSAPWTSERVEVGWEWVWCRWDEKARGEKAAAQGV